ncbi:hypothetical protein [Streptomyces xiamenensis]|uniref:hypothetical protein n=1 Tax=Streptomyces xiamenensis TaxID=408015 RepID=UPI0037D8366D
MAERLMTLFGGPLDGQQWDLGWATDDELREGMALINDENGAYGPGGRSCYSLHGDGVMRWDGDVP